MKNQITQRLYRLGLALIILIPTVLSGIKYYNYSYDLDELFTIEFAKNINTIKYWQYLDGDLGNPPLFSYLLKPFVIVSGAEIWLRLLPLSFYLLSTLIFVKVLDQMQFSKAHTLLLVSIFSSLAPFWYLRFYVRAYSLLLLLVLLTVYFTFQLFKQPSKKILLKLLIAVFFGLNTHYIYLVFYAIWFSLVIFFTFSKDLKRSTKRYLFLSVIFTFLLVLPLVIHLIMREYVFSIYPKYDWWQFIEDGRPSLLWWQWISKINFIEIIPEESGNYLWLVVLMVWLYTLFYKNINIYRKFWVAFIFLFWVTYFLSPLSKYLTQEKYLAIFLVFTFVGPSITGESLITRLIPKYNRKFLFVILIPIVVIYLVTLPKELKMEGGDDWKSFIREVDGSKENYDLVIDCWAKPAFDHYMNKQRKMFGYWGFVSDDDCDLPSALENIDKVGNLLFVGTKEFPLPNIDQTHYFFDQNYEYSPIVIVYYKRIK